MIRRILLSLSGPPFHQSTVSHATDLAARHGARISAVGVLDEEALGKVGPVPTGGGASAADLRRHRVASARAVLEKTAQELERVCGTRDIARKVTVASGDPLAILKSYWRYHDLTIIPIRNPFAHSLGEHLDEDLKRVIQAGLKPIFAVAEEYRPIRKVLAAYNGSEHSARAIKRFVQKRPWPEAQMKIICFSAKTDSIEQLLESSSEYCRDHGFEVETAHPKGSAREGLLKEATAWDADLIVMGASPRMKVSEWMWGDTALEVLKRSRISLFLAQ